MKFKNLIKDESGVAYLLLVGFFLTIIIVGMVYMILSDLGDTILSSLASAYSQNPDFTMDADGIYGGNMLLTLLKYSLMFILIILSYWVLSMSQKPQRGY